MNMNKILTTAALALMMTACSNDYNEAALQPGAGHEITVTATIDADGGSTLTRTVAESETTITSSLTADEQIAVLFSDGTTNLSRTATVKSVADGTATIEFTIPSTLANNTACTLVYPATAAKADNTDVKTYAELFATQTGILSDDLDVRRGTATIEFTIPSSLANNTACTLVYPATAAKADNTDVKTYAELFATQTGVLSDDLDVRRGTATIQNDGITASLSDATKLAAQNAIVKFSLSYGSDAIAATQFLVKDGSDNVLTTVTPAATGGASDLYVVMAPATDADFHFEASEGDFDYTYEKTGVTLAAGTYYQSPITMDVVEHDMEVSASGFSGTYDGWSHGISVTAPDDATVKYGTAANACDLDNSPKYTNAGTYTIYYEVTKDKYTTVTGSATVKIYKAAGSISYSETTAVHMVSDVAFKNPLTLSGTASVSYSSDDTNVATVAADGTVTILAKGTATITATVTSSTNYSYSPDYAQYTLIVHSPTVVGPSGGYEDGGVDPINNN